MKNILLTSTAALALGSFALAADSAAQNRCESEGFCTPPASIGKQSLNSNADGPALEGVPPANTERRDQDSERPPHGHSQPRSCINAPEGAHQTSAPFRISIDGAPLNGAEGMNSADVVRCRDMALEKADIQLRFEPLDKGQALNVTVVPQAVVRGEAVTFTPTSNYLSFIARAEVRIFKEGASLQSKPLAIVPIDALLAQDGVWHSPTGSKDNHLQYVLRVYDAKGRFDETKPQIFRLLDERRPAEAPDTEDREKLSGYGENNLSIRNIPVSGGMVTINGENLAPGSKVRALALDVPVDAQGKFATRQILPEGVHEIAIQTSSPDGSQTEITRPVLIPQQDWFYIALADLTFGKNSVDGPAKLVTGKDTRRYDSEVFVDGRLAFYTKGKVKNDWQVTASADTKEQPIEDLFSNFTNKDPRSLLKRIDPKKYYQVYGDDSTTLEDAPTQGKFYIKAEKDDSHIMWGNFQTRVTGTDLLDYSRTLYGANAQYLSPETTRLGERRTEINAFGADPGTVASLEEFRGTGGSLYYLRGQDVVIGSERLRIETRDRDSGIVLNTQYLVYGQDYEINYSQGRILLREPLSSTASGDSIVSTGPLSGNPAYLVAGYEHSPSVTEINNLTKGGRVSHWFNDHIRLGATIYDQQGSGLDQTLAGADMILRYAPGTYLKIEKARSKGAGNGSLSSTDGGFNFDSLNQIAGPDIEANANRAEIAVDLSDLLKGRRGTLSAYTLHRQEGFSSPGQLTDEEITQHGFSANLPVNEKLTLGGKLDLQSAEETGDRGSGEISGSYQINPERNVTVALRHDDNSDSETGGESDILSEEGARSDLALKYHYTPLNSAGEKERYDVYGLVQGTLRKTGDRENNHRAGIGGRYDLNDKIRFNGELTGGNKGVGALIGAEYLKTDRTSYYANYLLDPDRTDIGYRGRSSSLTFGGRSRYSDSLSVFGEQRYQSFDDESSGLIHSFGLDLAASDRWTWGGRFENGIIADPESGDTDRLALSLTSGYNAEKTKYSGTIEFRRDENDLEGDRNSWLMSNTLSYQTSEDWRVLTDLDVAISDSGLNSTLDADYIEFGLGYAYRPVNNDRLNALIRYEYLSDLASPDQLDGSRTGDANDYEQRNHVFSADAIYDVTPKLAVGGKVGYRFGEIRDNTVEGSEFFDSQALLLIGRMDYEVLKSWEFTGEVRYLDVMEAEDSKAGVLLGAYKHFNQNIKAGVGYNFTDFSDDLTDLDYDSRGVFFNVVGKF